jgi:dihydroorotate dehydrogenase (NAD+) catalytic subunit
VTGGILNTIGLQNVGVERFIEEKWGALRKLPVPVIVSVAGESAEDYIGVVQRLNTLKGVAAIELNLSCPNLQKKIICLDTALVASIIKETAKISKVPVFAKLSPMVQDLAGLTRVAENAGAAAVSLVNTFPGMAIDTKTMRPKLAVVTGGMSGPAIKPLALRCVWEVARQTKLPVIGGGGIMSGEDAVEFLLAGAAAVSVGTASFTDPLNPVKVASGIGEYQRRMKLKSTKDITGKLRV